MSELVCPGCGKPARYRVPRRFSPLVRARDEYRCGPHEDGYVYLHPIDPDQAVQIAYPWQGVSP